MLKRWLPQDRILKRAVNALVAFLLLLAIAGGLGAWDEHQRGGDGEEHNNIAEAVWQYGATSPEAAAAVQQVGQSGHAPALVALLDPTTGKAITAWPADQAGKSPDQMALPGGAKLPAIDKLLYRPEFKLRPADNSARLTVRVTPLYPWGSDRGEEGHGRGGDFRLGFRQGGEWGRGHGAEQQKVMNPSSPATVAKPEAVLLVATPPEAVSVLRVLAGIAGGLAAVAFIIYWLSVAWWVFADARRRGSKAFAWGVLALLTNLVGAAVYLVARREQRNCSACGATVDRSFNHCPQCGNALKRICDHCGHELRDGWTHCANCGTPYSNNN